MPKPSSKRSSSLLSYGNYRKILWLVSLVAPIFFVVACMIGFTEKSFLNYMTFGWISLSFCIMYLLGAFAIACMASKKNASPKLKDDFITWGIGGIAYAVQGALALFRHHHQVESDYVEDGLPSEVADYGSNVPMALSDARFEVFLGYVMAMNTLFACFWFKQEFANTLWRWFGGKGEKALTQTGDSSD